MSDPQRFQIVTVQILLPKREYPLCLVEKGMPAFAQMLAQDVIDYLLPAWKQYESLSPFQRTFAMHNRTMHANAELLSTNKDVADEAVQILLNERGTTLLLYGSGGVGKTTLASYVARELSGVNGLNVLFVSCGITANTTTANGVLQLELQFLKGVLDMDPGQGNAPGAAATQSPRDK